MEEHAKPEIFRLAGLRVRIDEKEQKELFIKFIKKLNKDFSKASSYLGITNSNLSKYKRAKTKYLPKEVLEKTANYLNIETPKIIEEGTLAEIRKRYIKKAHPVLREKYGSNWARELTKRRDYKGISLDDFPEYIFVYLEEDYRKRILRSAYNLAGSLEKLSKIINISTSRLSFWYKGEQRDYKRNVIGLQFIPLSKLRLISKLLLEDNNLEFSMENIEKKITMYRMQAGNPIVDPILPIKESPEMVRLLFHLLGDGYSGNKKDMANFKNTCPELLEEFRSDLSIFGKVPIYRQQYSIKFPRLIAEIIENFYNVNTMTFDSKISTIILKIPKKWLYHGIRAFADDEGCVLPSSIGLYSANYKLLEGIKKLLDYLKIRRGEIKILPSKKATYGVMYMIEIKDLEIYHKKIGFTHPKKKDKLERYVKKKKTKRRKRFLKLKP